MGSTELRQSYVAFYNETNLTQADNTTKFVDFGTLWYESAQVILNTTNNTVIEGVLLTRKNTNDDSSVVFAGLCTMIFGVLYGVLYIFLIYFFFLYFKILIANNLFVCVFFF